MRAVAVAACVVASVCLSSPTFAAKSQKGEVKSSKPMPVATMGQYSWAQCFQLSIDRGMDHEYEEWRQFIADCMQGLIPLK